MRRESIFLQRGGISLATAEGAIVAGDPEIDAHIQAVAQAVAQAAIAASRGRPKWLAGEWHEVADYGGTIGTVTLAANRLLTSPIPVYPGLPLDRIGTSFTTGAGTVARLMLFLPDANGRAGALALDAGTVDPSSTADRELTIAYTVPDGVYVLYGAIVADSTPIIRAVAASTPRLFGSTTPGANSYKGYAYATRSDTTAPASFVVTAYGTSLFPLISVRAQ